MNRRLVIPDIHGCSKTFKALVEKVALSREDTLFLLGDYIDRGPDNCGVIDFIIKLKSDGYDVRPIRGNHEQEFIEVFEEYDTQTFRIYAKRFRSLDLLTSDGKIKEPYLYFMSNLPYIIELPDYYLVHGGINFEKENPFDDKHSLLVSRKTVYNANNAGNRRIIFGHQPTYYQEIKNAIDQRASLIPLDNGCIYNKSHKVYDYTRLGKLLCLDMDTFELFEVANSDT